MSPLDPLPAAHTIQLTEPDLAREMFSRLYSATSIDIHRDAERQFAWVWTLRPNGPITVIQGHARLGFASVGGEIPYYVLALVQEGTLDLSSSKNQTRVICGQSAALINANTEALAFTPMGTKTLNIRIDPLALMSHASALAGTPVSTLPTFHVPLDLRHGSGADILRLAQLLRDAMERPDTPMGSPHVVAHLREALIGTLLLGQENTLRPLLQKPPPVTNTRAIKHVEEILAARAPEPISMTEIAAQTGIGLRSLERSYKAARGGTLRTFLRERRLELAHQRLCAATPGMTVAQVLYASGFSRPGEFSQAYQRRFGVAPSETLRRALGQGRRKGKR